MLKLDVTQSCSELSNFLNQRRLSQQDLTHQVESIANEVRQEGWAAIARYTEKFDQVKLQPNRCAFSATPQAMQNALDSLPAKLRQAIELSISRVRDYHTHQLRQDWYRNEPGIRTGQIFRPLQRVGIYAPAGTAPLFSSVIMDIVPAQVAGCPEICVCSPPQKDTGGVHPLILATCQLLNIPPEQIFAMGGAQAVFALAYGLEELPGVDGVFGPGNQYVMAAKQLVQGQVRIESLAGNSEILIIADETANPAYVAADLLSQAEHMGGEMSILVTPSERLLEQVESEVDRQIEQLMRKDIARRSMDGGGVLIKVAGLPQGCEIANQVAPEHLEIQTEDPLALLPQIQHAGAVFLGPWSTEPVGDYTTGTNHVLPTGGTARFSSALSVDDFIKKISVIQLDQDGLKRIGPAAMEMAAAEGLQAHRQAIAVRLEQ